MRLRELKVAGFRGFNEERQLDFHDAITVIGARNSHGKTSISEALEFLLYGATSKVENADSKDEYSNSYRNRHYPDGLNAYIEALFVDPQGNELRLRVEILPGEAGVRRLLNGAEVEAWPFQDASLKAARPFVLQHALKYLLLVPPSERFQGFARLLGLGELDVVFQALVGLCTKLTANLPADAQALLAELTALEARLPSYPYFKKSVGAMKKGSQGLGPLFEAVEQRADVLLEGAALGATTRTDALRKQRQDAAAKVYKGELRVAQLSPQEASDLSAAHKTLTETVTPSFLADYGFLAANRIDRRLQKELQLLGLGAELVALKPEQCPLCLQPLTEASRGGITARKQQGALATAQGELRRQASERISKSLKEAARQLQRHRDVSTGRTADLLRAMEPANEAKIATLLGTAANLGVVRSASVGVTTKKEALTVAAESLEAALNRCADTVASGEESLPDAESLGNAIKDYLVAGAAFDAAVHGAAVDLDGPAKVFRQALDALAGTAETTLLIDLLDQRVRIKKALIVREIIEGLKELKRHAEQTLAETMDAAMSSELTAAVMTWYEKIKTDGDPNVHFSGFAMDKTKAGDFKARRLSVKAESYGVQLASAVSSLSESKLNALGLSTSIASAIRAPGPWGFLVLDDPIQSWDDAHEHKFVDVIRDLVAEEKRQVIVLTHNTEWAKVVANGCRSMNGVRYEITSYLKQGPTIKSQAWCPIDHRFIEANKICDNANADSDEIRRAEEEIRHIAYGIAAEISAKCLAKPIDANKLNATETRAVLTQAGLKPKDIDSIYMIVAAGEAAHHPTKQKSSYQPSRDRARSALGTLQKLHKDVRQGNLWPK